MSASEPKPTSQGRRLLARVFGFSAIPAIGALSPLIVLPILVRVDGGDAWAALALGQAVGATASLISQWGWGSAGPSLVSMAAPAERAGLFRESLVVRSVMVVLLLGPALLVAAVLAPSDLARIASLAAASSLLLSLSPSWYWIGVGSFGRIAMRESIPRLAATICAAVLARWSGSLAQFPIAMIVFTAVIAGAGTVSILVENTGGAIDRQGAVKRFRSQATLAGSSISSAAYTTLVLPAVAAANPSALPLYAAVDRVANLVKVGLTPTRNALQGWVTEGGALSSRRAQLAILLSLGVGTVVAGAFAALLPIVDGLLFGDEIIVSWQASCMGGLALWAVSVSGGLIFSYLVPLGRYRIVWVATATAGAFGLPAIYLLARSAGAVGALAGLAVAEICVLAILLVAVFRRPGMPILTRFRTCSEKAV